MGRNIIWIRSSDLCQKVFIPHSPVQTGKGFQVISPEMYSAHYLAWIKSTFALVSGLHQVINCFEKVVVFRSLKNREFRIALAKRGTDSR